MPLNEQQPEAHTPSAPPPASPQATDTPDHSNRCTFKLTKDDWYACFDILAKRLADQTRSKASIWTTSVLPWVFFGMTLFTFFHLYEKYPWLGIDFSLVAGFFCIGILLHITGSSYRRKIRRELIIPSNSIYLDEIKFEALPAGMKLENRGGVSFIRWNVITHLAEDKKNLYLFISDLTNVILPKKTLGHELVALVKKHITH